MKAPGEKTTKPKTDKSKSQEGKNLFPIVGIGASAGGLEVLAQFFVNMPPNNGLAFVVIQHLDPDHVGIMPELLQRSTSMKVIQAAERMKVKPDQVFVIPPGKSMSLLNGELHLFEPSEKRGLRLPIDIFFRSLANDQEEKSIGIILSGMGSDGSLGIKAIKERNGIVLVQDPATAKFDSMPRNAVESVIADIVAPVNELPSKLISFLKIHPATKPNPEKEWRNKSNIDKIIILLRDRSGIDFSQYKKSTLFRRVERRKGVHQINALNSYVRFLQENHAEQDILVKELLIGVSNFFRDNQVWEMLQKETLPELIDQSPDGVELRAWVPACSTGEEAYSLAISFMEAMEMVKSPKRISLRIFATDLNSDAIDVARKGFYAKNISADVSPERLHRFFTTEADGYRINNVIREMVIFAVQNVIKDPPFTKIDILSCRNMLIYMEAELQKKILSLFNYSLKPNGILILGIAETPGVFKDGVKAIDGNLKIFRRMGLPKKPDFTEFQNNRQISKAKAAGKNTHPVMNLQSQVDQMLLQRFTPASVLVNEEGDILYITGRTGKYLEPAAGRANWNIYAMAREGLRQELHGALQASAGDSEPVILKNLRIGNNSESHWANVTFQRFENAETSKNLIIIVFDDLEVTKEMIHPRPNKTNSKGRAKELEIELKHSQDELESSRNKMQTTEEELKSINEELQSANEELQSTNEELTTSKEEMQSMNEELQTVNTELQSKINDFIRAEDDMKNLLNSTEIATLFLDRDQNIRRFTDQVTKIFKLRKSDIGRPITDLANELRYNQLENDALEVLKTLVPSEKAVETNDGRWFEIRVIPYRTLDDRIDGVVITFSDITRAKKLEQELVEANKVLRGEG